MRSGLLLILTSVALVACGPDSQQSAEAPENAEQSTELSCATFAGLTAATLAERYGAENVTTETLSDMEGEPYQATYLYPNDAARKIEFIWNEAGGGASILVHGAQWTGPGGLRQGASMPDVERINGRAFKFWGFGWDYGGWVSDWNGGALAERDNCMTRVHFDARDLDNAGAVGDSEYMSDAAGAQNGEPFVTGFGFAYTN